ncbi:MAG: EamA family transporter [Luteitalea sp.]|nr:EamA family transporter [Luteitalea sp.]
MHDWLAFALIALMLWGITGVTQKLATNHISFELSFVCFSLAFVLMTPIIIATVPLDWNLSPGLIGLAALGGLLNGLGALTSFAALERGGKASTVIPLVSLYPLITLAGAWLLLDEDITLRQTVGIGCAVVAVCLLAQEPVAPAGSFVDEPMRRKGEI